MLKEDFIKLLDQKPTGGGMDFLNQPFGSNNDDDDLDGSWMGTQKYDFELTVQQIEITNVTKAPTICSENDLIKLAVNLEDSPHSDAVQLQKIKSYPALIKRSRTSHVLTLSWNQTFHFSTSMHSDKLGGVSSKEVIRIKIFRVGQSDDEKSGANEKANNLGKSVGEETVLAECDLILLQEVVESHMLQDSATINGQLCVYELNTNDDADGASPDDGAQRRRVGSSPVNRLGHGGRRRERLGNLQYELKVKTRSPNSESNSNSVKQQTELNSIKLELNDEKEEKDDDWLKRRTESGKGSSFKDKLFSDEYEERRKKRFDELEFNLSPKSRIVDYKTSETAFDPEKDFQLTASLGRRSFGIRERKGPIDEEELLEKPWLDDAMDKRQVKEDFEKMLGSRDKKPEVEVQNDKEDDDFMKSDEFGGKADITSQQDYRRVIQEMEESIKARQQLRTSSEKKGDLAPKFLSFAEEDREASTINDTIKNHIRQELDVTGGTLISKSLFNETENNFKQTKVELAKNIDASKKDEDSSKLSSSFDKNKRARFTSHNKELLDEDETVDEQEQQSDPQLNNQSEPVQGNFPSQQESFADVSDIFERDENATDSIIAQSLRLGKSLKFEEIHKDFDKSVERSGKSQNVTKKQAMFDDSIDEREDEDEDDAVEDDEEQEPSEKYKEQHHATLNEKESLNYSDYSATLNASSLNFAFSGTKSNLAALTAQQNEAEEDEMQKNYLPQIAEDVTDQEEDAEKDDQDQFEFDLTQTQGKFVNSLQNKVSPFRDRSRSVRSPKDNGKELEIADNNAEVQPFEPIEENDTPQSKTMNQGQMSMVSALSRGSGMSSGNFCLAADNIFSMNEKCRRLEQDKQRLTMQLNHMLTSYKDLQTKHEMTLTLTENNEEQQAAIEDLINKVQGAEKEVEELKMENCGLHSENEELKKSLGEKSQKIEKMKKEMNRSGKTSKTQGNDSDFSRDLEEEIDNEKEKGAVEQPSVKEEGIQTTLEPQAERPSFLSYMQTSQGDGSWALTQDDLNILRHSVLDKQKIEDYVRKFAEKFYRIYKKLNVKFISKDIVNQELDPQKPLLSMLDCVAGNLNKVFNQLNQFMKQNDTEIDQYKNIISNKLRPQLQKLIEENNKLRNNRDSQNTIEDTIPQSMTLGLHQEIGKLKGENKFMRDRIECLQRQLESYIDQSPQIYLNEIKRLKMELSHNQSDIQRLVDNVRRERNDIERDAMDLRVSIPERRTEFQTVPLDTGFSNRSNNLPQTREATNMDQDLFLMFYGQDQESPSSPTRDQRPRTQDQQAFSAAGADTEARILNMTADDNRQRRRHFSNDQVSRDSSDNTNLQMSDNITIEPNQQTVMQSLQFIPQQQRSSPLRKLKNQKKVKQKRQDFISDPANTTLKVGLRGSLRQDTINQGRSPHLSISSKKSSDLNYGQQSQLMVQNRFSVPMPSNWSQFGTNNTNMILTRNSVTPVSHQIGNPGAAAIPVVSQQGRTGIYKEVREPLMSQQAWTRERGSPFQQSDLRMDHSDQRLSSSTGKRGGSQTSAYKKLRLASKFKTVEEQINKFRNENDACKLKIMKLEQRLHSGIDFNRIPATSEAARSPNDSLSHKTFSRKSQSKSKSTAAQSVLKKSTLTRQKKGVKVLKKSSIKNKNLHGNFRTLEVRSAHGSD